MHALIVGFGGMGCRHAQSLLSSGRCEQIAVVEPSDEKFNEGLAKIKAVPTDVKRFSSLAEYSEGADIVIVATSSGPRFDIMTQLLRKGYKRFLLEKILFQSVYQFNEIITLLEKYQAKAYCNFVNRYFANYKRLREVIHTRQERVDMTVIGGDLGLGCNAIHYMDLFEYLTGAHIADVNSKISASPRENKRGSSYKEFSGLITARNDREDALTIYFDDSHSGGVTLRIDIGRERHILSEGKKKELHCDRGNIVEDDFILTPSSLLTAGIVEDILAGRSILTTVEQTKNAHAFLFKEMNRTLNLPENERTLCPIT